MISKIECLVKYFDAKSAIKDDIMASGIEKLLQKQVFKLDDAVINEGDVSDCFYIICSGMAKIFIRNENGDETIAVLKEGQVLGEVGFLSGISRTASCVAMADCELVKISKETFSKIKKDYPELAIKIYEKLVYILSSRLKSTTNRMFGRFV